MPNPEHNCLCLVLCGTIESAFRLSRIFRKTLDMKSKLISLAFVCGIVLALDATPARCAPEAQKSTLHDPLQSVQGLHAVRKSDKVTLTWSQPRYSSVGASAERRYVSAARVCRDISSTPPDSNPAAKGSTTACGQPVAEVDVNKSAGAPPMGEKFYGVVTLRFMDTLPEELLSANPPQFAIYRIEMRDKQGRSAGFSSPVSVSLAPTVPARGLHFSLDVHGVYLIWDADMGSHPTSVQFDYRIYRQEKGSRKRVAVSFLRAILHQRDGERWSGVDTSIEWEKTYTYWVRPVTRVYSEGHQLIAEIEGEDSAPVPVVAHDVFAPATPEGLLALASEIPKRKFVDLMWMPNAEKDLAGYNVYRREEGGKLARINSDPITMLSFQDTDVIADHKYFYAISAIDLRGNESSKSEESTEVAP